MQTKIHGYKLDISSKRDSVVQYRSTIPLWGLFVLYVSVLLRFLAVEKQLQIWITLK